MSLLEEAAKFNRAQAFRLIDDYNTNLNFSDLSNIEIWKVISMRKTLSKARLKSNQHHILVKRYLNMLMLYEPSLEGLLLRAIEDPSCTLTSLILGLTLALTSGLLAGDYWILFWLCSCFIFFAFSLPYKRKELMEVNLKLQEKLKEFNRTGDFSLFYLDKPEDVKRWKWTILSSPDLELETKLNLATYVDEQYSTTKGLRFAFKQTLINTAFSYGAIAFTVTLMLSVYVSESIKALFYCPVSLMIFIIGILYNYN